MATYAGQSPWRYFLQRDDRLLLKDLSSHHWSSQYIIEKIPGIIFSALRSLHFSRSHRWGVAISTETMRPIALQFLEWMRVHKEWDKCENLWSQKGKGPWSLPYQVFRSYYRFRRSEYPKGVKGEVSYSGQRSLLDIEGASLENALTGPFLEAFSFITFSLPEPLQLPYQLHLEGLLPNEISKILGIQSKKIDEAINAAKEILSAGYTKAKESA
jgi:hypothetical protein